MQRLGDSGSEQKHNIVATESKKALQSLGNHPIGVKNGHKIPTVEDTIVSTYGRYYGCGGGICCPTFDIVDLLGTDGLAILLISRFSNASLYPPPAALGVFVPRPPGYERFGALCFEIH